MFYVKVFLVILSEFCLFGCLVSISMYVKWGYHCSAPFRVSNGVRQGGLLSPISFNVYMYDLCIRLNSCRIGCCFNDSKLNHLMYADDIVLLAPSVKGLDQLITICHSYGLENDIIYNAKKSYIVPFRKGAKSLTITPSLKLGTTPIPVSEKIKYLGCILMHNLSDAEDIKTN